MANKKKQTQSAQAQKNVNLMDKEFDEVYETMDVRPGIKRHAREIARAAYMAGVLRGQDRSGR